MADKNKIKQEIFSLTRVELKDLYGKTSAIPKTIEKKKVEDKASEEAPHLSNQLKISGNLAKGILPYTTKKKIGMQYYAWNGWNFIGAKQEANRDVYNGKSPQAGPYELYQGYGFWNSDYSPNFNSAYTRSKLRKADIKRALIDTANDTDNSEEAKAIKAYLKILRTKLKGNGKIGQSLPYTWQAHHILPMDAFQTYFKQDEIQIIGRSDYDINHGSNIILLPSEDKAMKYHRLPGHWTDHPQYTKHIKNEFKKIRAKIDEIRSEEKDHKKIAAKFAGQLHDLESNQFDILVKAGPRALHQIKTEEFEVLSKKEIGRGHTVKRWRLKMDYYVMASAVDEAEQAAEIDEHPDDLPIKPYKFRKGVPLRTHLAEPLIYQFSKDAPKGRRLVDLQPNSEGLFIVSLKLKTILDGQPNIEFIRIRLLDHRGKVASEDYHLANMLDPLDCIDIKQSEYRQDKIIPSEFNRINKLVLDARRIPKDIHIFRLKQTPNTVVLDSTLAKPIIDQKLVGPHLVPIAEFDSAYFLGV